MAGDLAALLRESATSLARGVPAGQLNLDLQLRGAADELESAEQMFAELVADLHVARQERDSAVRSVRESNRLYAQWRQRAEKAEAKIAASILDETGE